MRNSIWRAALLSASFLLCLFLPGCGSRSPAILEETTEEVQLSNLKTPDSLLSGEEKAVLNDVQQILKSAVFDRYGNTLTVENATKKELTLTIHLSFFDENGVCRADANTVLAAWQPGERACVSIGSKNGYFSYLPDLSVQAIGEFPYEGTTLMTDPQPIVVTERLGNENINIQPEKELPFILTASDKTQYRVEEATVFLETVVLKITKIGGRQETGHAFSVRIMDKDGLVVFSDTFSDYYLKPGETEFMYSIAHNTEFPRGNYTLSIDCID